MKIEGIESVWADCDIYVLVLEEPYDWHHFTLINMLNFIIKEIRLNYALYDQRFALYDVFEEMCYWVLLLGPETLPQY